MKFGEIYYFMKERKKSPTKWLEYISIIHISATLISVFNTA